MTEEQENIDTEEEDELYEHQRIVVDKGQVLMRLDKYLPHFTKSISRNKIQNSIDAEAIKVNGITVKASYRVKPLDVITFSLPKPPRNTELIPEDIPLNIVFEDDDVMIINKPAGMVVHPAVGHWTGTLVNGLIYYLNTGGEPHLPTHRNGEIRPGLVHRIDKDTSGLLVIAKNDFAMTFLAKQFFDHSIERTYYAMAWGVPKEPQGTIHNFIGRSLKNRKICDVFEDGSYGKDSITHYKVLKDLRYVSLLQCNLETGRTHQIRVHMKHLGHPLFSDSEYGGDKILRGQVFSNYKKFVENCFETMPRQALHAKTLGFVHPRTKEWMQFDTDLPEDFSNVIEKWENYLKNN